MDDAIQALMISFAMIVFVMAITASIYLLNGVSTTSQYLTYHADSTRFYDRVKISAGTNVADASTRCVSAETIVPTLYRYCKETFCVKIFDSDGSLIQIFDLELEDDVRSAVKSSDLDVKLARDPNNKELNKYKAYRNIYNDPNKKGYYMFGVPWKGRTEDIKARIDLFVAGSAGYINDEEVNYKDNAFAASLNRVGEGIDANGQITDENAWKSWHYSEKFISYSYSGSTVTTDDGDVLIEGQKPKDKIIIEYRRLGS